MSADRNWWSPAVWLVYVVIVFEILFMISPFALYYYSAYAHFLNFLGGSPATAWLDQFFLPHFSQTSSPVLTLLGEIDEAIFFAGVALFLVGFVQIYFTKFFRRGRPVTGLLYRWIRHPQYLAVAIIGIGVMLHWPRFLVLVGYVTMLFLYYFLARHEERRCLARYGVSYQDYLDRTGMFLPRSWTAWVPRWLPERGVMRTLTVVLAYILLVGAAVGAGLWLQDYSVRQVAHYSTRDLAVLSPAQLEPARLEHAVQMALTDPAVAQQMAQRGYGQGEKFLAYVVPVDWHLPDLPMEAQRAGGHVTPNEFDPNRLKVLLTRVVLYDHKAEGLAIVKRGVKRQPIALVKVDLAQHLVLGWETPPATVRWGDVPTPYF
jgi:protein-S-isoprenylcysteine O-methyltransferase Ste14